MNGLQNVLQRVPGKGIALPLAVLVAAEIGHHLSDYHSDALAAPSQIVPAWFEALGDGTLAVMTMQTLATALGGLSIGIAVGLIFGVVFAIFPVIDRLMMVMTESLRPIPSVALFPIAMLTFGLGYRMEISVVAFSTVWPVLLLTRAAIRGIDTTLLEVARVLRLSVWQRIVKIILPAIVPRVFVAIRLAAGVSLIVAITIEIAANPLGLGAGMMIASQSLRSDLMFALLLWIGVVGWTFNALLRHLQGVLFGPMSRELETPP